MLLAARAHFYEGRISPNKGCLLLLIPPMRFAQFIDWFHANETLFPPAWKIDFQDIAELTYYSTRVRPLDLK